MQLKELSSNILMFSLSEYFCCEWSDDDKILILNDDGIDIHDFKPNPESKNKYPEFERSFIPPLDINLNDKSGYKESVIVQLSRHDLFRALSNPFVTTQFSFNPPVSVKYKRALWCSKDVLSTKNCLLATISVIGSTLIWHYKTTWNVLLDVTQLIFNHLNDKKLLRLGSTDPVELLDDSMFNSDLLRSTAMTWSEVFVEEDKQYSYFVTAQKSGHLFVWRLDPEESICDVSLNAKLATDHHCDLKEVSEIRWITTSKNTVCLILGSTEGLVQCIFFKRDASNFVVTKVTQEWTEEDNLAVSKIVAFRWDECSHFIAVVKRTFVISFVLDDDENSSQLNYQNFGNLNITSFQKINDREIYMSTVTQALFHLTLKEDSNNLPYIESSGIETNIKLWKYSLHGLTLSKSNALWLMLLNPSKYIRNTQGKSCCKIVFGYSEHRDPLLSLLENRSEVLTDKWDDLELTRILKVNGVYSDSQIRSLLRQEDCKTLYSTKLLYWLSVMCEDVDSKSQLIKTILSKHAAKHITELANKIKNGHHVSQTEAETVSAQYKLVESNDFDVLFNVENLPVSDDSFCEWCNEKLHYPVCSENHVREFCCITFRNVDGRNALKCPLCSSLAHVDLWKSAPVCTFCDSQLQILLLCE